MIVYTAIFGDRPDPLPPVNFPGTPHVLYTDRPERYAGKGWEIRVPPFIHNDPRTAARLVKTSPENFLDSIEVTLWIDGNVGLRVDPKTIASTHLIEGEPDFFVCAHPTRTCIFAEARACASLKKDSPLKMLNQVTAYEDHGFPRNAGLYETGLPVGLLPGRGVAQSPYAVYYKHGGNPLARRKVAS